MSPPLLDYEALPVDAQKRRRMPIAYEEFTTASGELNKPGSGEMVRSLSNDSLTETSDTSFESIEDGRILVEEVSVCETVKQSRRVQVQAVKLCFGAAGVYACYLAYGHIQEDIYRYEGEDGSKFTSVWLLQVLECACNVVVGTIGRQVCGGHRPSKAAMRGFFQSGASQVFAKVLTSLSLAAGLSFPICVLAKSAKIVPVMLGQLILGGSKYTVQDYVFAGAVVVGTTLLSLGKKSSQEFTTPAGLIFIFLSLVADGFTAGLQKRLKKETENKPPTTYDFLFFTNLAMGIVAFTIAVALGDLVRGYAFMSANPVLQQMVIMSCLLSALGQSFIFFVVAHFDPMVCATVTTTRKILSVVWSIAVKGHSISLQGYFGVAMAIGGILLGLVGKRSKKRNRDGKEASIF
jgi:solute carrier family 35 (UDP-galactose transporter), member B1